MPEGRRTQADGHIEVYPLCDADGPTGRRCVLPAGHDGRHSSSNLRYPETSWPATPEPDRLTPEERAVIEAANKWYDGTSGSSLTVAVAAYRKATAPPEPFEAFLGRSQYSYAVAPSLSEHWPEVYRCTVTPIERVR